MQETLGIMGLSSSAFYASYFATYTLVFLVIAAVLTKMLQDSFMAHADGFLLFLYFFLFFTSLTALGFLLSAFFSKAKLAVAAAPLVIIVFVLPRYVFFSTTEDEARSMKLACGLLSPSAFAFGADTLLAYEDARVGVQWNNMDDGNFSFGDVLRLLFGDTLLYVVLAWYFANVWPSEYGLRREPWFVLLSDYWRSNWCKPNAAADTGALVQICPRGDARPTR